MCPVSDDFVRCATTAEHGEVKERREDDTTCVTRDLARRAAHDIWHDGAMDLEPARHGQNPRLGVNATLRTVICNGRRVVKK